MKKFLVLLMALCMLLSAVPALADVADAIAAGEAMTHDELVAKAMAETGDFVVWGNTSRITTAAENFGAIYGITPVSSNLKDQEIYTKLENESADMVLIQDSASLTYAIEDGIVLNYVPASVKDQLGEDDIMPLVHQYINKLFIYNKLGEDVPAIKNVWELTDASMKGRVIFKNPENETVNMNFLVMLTNDEWSAKLAEAYKALYGKDIELGSYKNAGYKWIAEFLPNCTFINSDTTIAEEVSQETAAGKIGLFVLSKLRSSSVLTDNLTVAQYDATANGYAIDPFAGFMYCMYAQIPANSSRPYTAMLFIEYLMTAEGFQPWGKSIGAYSPVAAIAVNAGDLTIDVWKDTLVVEDPEYIIDNFEAVNDFVIRYLQ